MPVADAKSGFALLCLAGVVAIATGAALEINRMRRGESIISLGHLRLRLVSALVWMALLGSTAYALLYLWPAPGDAEQARRFLSVVSGVIVLLVIGMALLLYDVWQVGRQQRRQQERFNRQLETLARTEIARHLPPTESSTSTPPTSPPDSAH